MKIIDKNKILSESKIRPISLIAGILIGGTIGAKNEETFSPLEEIAIASFGGLGVSSIIYADKIRYNNTQNKEKWEKDANMINSCICLTNYSVGAVIGYYGIKLTKIVNGLLF